jgi:hypothetical protein
MEVLKLLAHHFAEKVTEGLDGEDAEWVAARWTGRDIDDCSEADCMVYKLFRTCKWLHNRLRPVVDQYRTRMIDTYMLDTFVTAGNVAGVQAFCRKADLNFRGGKPLKYAISHHHSNTIVEILLEHGASVDIVSHNQPKTPLMYAAEHGNRHAIDLLVGRGADINVCIPNQPTPLMIAVYYRHKNVFDKLLALGADVDAAMVGENYDFLDGRYRTAMDVIERHLRKFGPHPMLRAMRATLVEAGAHASTVVDDTGVEPDLAELLGV